MIVPREVRHKHLEQAAQFEFVDSKVRETLLPYCANNGFVFDGRRKTLESLAEKIETGRFRSWSELDDLYACTIAVPLPEHEDRVLKYLDKVFTRIDLKERNAAKKAPDVFRFDSTRFVGQLRKPTGFEDAESVYSLRFEVQIKTLFELAWSRTTHALAYKSSRVDWRALRLVASLKASVEQMDLLLSDFDSAMECLSQSPWREIEKKNMIQEVFLALKNDIPSEVWPKDLSRFIENCYSLIEKLQREEQPREDDNGIDIYPAIFSLIAGYVIENSGLRYPRSISLFQMVFAVTTMFFSIGRDRNIWFPISREMEDLFPHVKSITTRFRFT